MNKKTRRNIKMIAKFCFESDGVEVHPRVGQGEYSYCNACGDEPEDKLVMFYYYSWDTQSRWGGSLVICRRCHPKIQDRINMLKQSIETQHFHEEVQKFKTRIRKES